MKGVLNLSFINHEDDDEEYILQLIHKGLNDTNIHTILMYGNHLVLGLLKTVSNVLKSNTTLTSLDMCKNAFQYGMYNLAEALKINHTLRRLNLQENGICSMGAMYLADVIRVNNTLEELFLGYNSIDPTGFDYLAEALKTNTGLSCLGLSDNCTDVSRFMDILELNNVSIQTLFLNQCYDRANQLCLRNTTIRQNIRNIIYLIIVTRKSSLFRLFPKEIVKMIAQCVWATRGESIWIPRV